MSVPPDSIVVNSCEYTPVYLIPSTSVTQAGSYFITQSTQDAPKPASDNLKTFYENSGNLESGLLSTSKPRILKKVGNNLKLASFLLPKSESMNIANLTPIPAVQPKQPIPSLSTNVIVKPAVTTVPMTATSNVDNNLIEIDRKIVRVGTIPNTKRTHYPRVLPKNKPKELKEKISTELTTLSNPLSKHTSVQLIKLGETYHSLNQLSDEQMKIVNKALKMFSDPEKIPREPAYDPVTNTKFIYKVVSPRDLTVVGRNKNMVPIMKKKTEAKKQKVIVTEEPMEETPQAEPKVTRSGRTVKLPKQMRPNESPHKPKKKVGNVVNCFQCSAEFCSLYRLQRHYEMYPTHIPARIHSNLFHCLLAIIKGGGEDDQPNIFIQQLEHLIEKIRTLLPCLLKKIDGKEGKQCTISDDIGRLFGMDPGKYNLNIDALNCIKDKDGHCIHNPAPKNHIQLHPNLNQHSHMWVKHNEEISNSETETEDCARINSVDKWPTVTKRILKLKQQKMNAKKIRLASENEQPIELGIDDMVTFSNCNNNCAINVVNGDGSHDVNKEVMEAPVTQDTVDQPTPAIVADSQRINPKTHIQFHSAHFDIRSSPIKLPSSLVRKFQLDPDKLSNYEVQIFRPLDIDTDQNDSGTNQTNGDLQEIFTDDAEVSKDPILENVINFDPQKDWQMTGANDNESSDESFIKSNILFDSSLTPEKTTLIASALQNMNDKPNNLFDTPSKSSDLIEANMLQIIGKSNDLMDSSLTHLSNKPNSLFDGNQSHGKEQRNVFCDASSIHVKPKCNSLIGFSAIQMKDKMFETALSHVKERSSNLFETSLLQPGNKTGSLVKDESLFNTDMTNVKERPNSLFDTGLMHMKDKDNLIDPSLLQDDNSNMFNSSISHQKDDDLLQQSLVHDNGTSLNGASLIDMKDNSRNTVNIDQGDSLSTNDNRLINQGQSVLNFLDALGNESLGLSYPETEIRNTAVDFQLDLFSFSNS